MPGVAFHLDHTIIFFFFFFAYFWFELGDGLPEAF